MRPPARSDEHQPGARAAGRPRNLLGRFRLLQDLRLVQIVNRRRSTARFVEVVVHELTHALQEYEGCLESMPKREAEREAGDAGFAAACDYLRVRGAY